MTATKHRRRKPRGSHHEWVHFTKYAGKLLMPRPWKRCSNCGESIPRAGNKPVRPCGDRTTWGDAAGRKVEA